MTLLEQKIGDWFGNGDVAVGKAALRDRIADGAFISTLAREIAARVKTEGLEGQVACSRPALSKLLRATEEEERLVREAREEGGHALAEQAVQVALDTPADRDAVQQARLKVETLRWMAAKQNGAYDDKSGVSVQVASSGSLFLQAVAKPGVLPPPRSVPQEIVAHAEPAALPASTVQRAQDVSEEPDD